MGFGLFLGFFLISHVLPLSVSAEEDTTCPESFNCGNLSGVGFPFFHSSHYPHCGFLKLNCEAKPSPTIVFDFATDQWVEALAIGNSAITLHDHHLELLLRDRSCEFFDHGVMPLPNFSSISYSIVPTITLYGCTKNPETSHNPADYFTGYKHYDECVEPDNGFTIYYQTPQHHAPTLYPNKTIPSFCTNVTLPMVSSDNYSEITDFFHLFTAEFDLEWHLSEDCYKCQLE